MKDIIGRDSISPSTRAGAARAQDITPRRHVELRLLPRPAAAARLRDAARSFRAVRDRVGGCVKRPGTGASRGH